MCKSSGYGALASAVAHQFDDAAQQREAASLGMWVFLATEVLFFGGLFAAYAAYHSQDPGAFATAGRHTKLWLGTLNTAVLLTSSLTMALAVRAAKKSARTALTGFLSLTVLLGLAFLAIKAVEYRAEIAEGLLPGSGFRRAEAGGPRGEMFFVLYFFMTGLHALHVTVGVAAVSVVAWRAKRGRYAASHTAVEMTGLYWHFVDVVWVYLYPLIYLINRH